MPTPLRTARQLAVACARIAADRKADNIVVLDVGEMLGLTDYFVIASGTNPRQLKAIGDALHAELKPLGYPRRHQEGRPEGGWHLVDFGDVVVHLFDAERRRFYDLDGAWADAARVSWGRRRAKATEEDPPEEG